MVGRRILKCRYLVVFTTAATSTDLDDFCDTLITATSNEGCAHKYYTVFLGCAATVSRKLALAVPSLSTDFCRDKQQARPCSSASSRHLPCSNPDIVETSHPAWIFISRVFLTAAYSRPAPDHAAEFQGGICHIRWECVHKCGPARPKGGPLESGPP